MRAFLAVFFLTCRNALRSHIFQFLLVLLLLAVVLIPSTVTGDGTASGYIQVSLLYSLSSVATLLSLSSLWMGCFTMTQDLDSYQLHMVVTKPVPRWSIFLAKWAGVFALHFVLLLIAGTVIYGIVRYEFSRQDFKASERRDAESEILSGRRKFAPEQPDFRKMGEEALRKRIAALAVEGKQPDFAKMGGEKQVLSDMTRQAAAQYTELKAKGRKSWVFKDLPDQPGSVLYLRSRTYAGKIQEKNQQRMTSGLWLVGIPRFEKPKEEIRDVTKEPYKVDYYAFSGAPEQFRGNEFYEKKLYPQWGIVTPDHKLYLDYINLDPKQEAQFFQLEDGPFLLVRVTGFFGNFFRGILVLALQLLIMSGLGCAAAGFLSMPVAVFFSLSYLLFGSLADYVVSTTIEAQIGFSYYFGKLLLAIVIPMQGFDVTDLIAKGELVEFSYIGTLFFDYLVIRALPLFALGVILYCKRELALVIRK
ncbi:MAG: hypothetical protein PHS41_00445 [Victivallaceae bacterium]|nr:hypothetical protein [Victivallaceae bacterium]